MNVRIVPPIGPNGFGIEAMRHIAREHGANHFVKQQPTTASDSSMLVNPQDSAMQYGLAIYELAEGISMTHSMATFFPSELRRIPARPGMESNATCSYIDVIDISLPYNLPHVVAVPRMKKGMIASFFSSDAPIFPRHVASRVELEGNFSEFIDAYAPPGEETNVFLYLAPNIMETLLAYASEFVVEFVDSHIYVYFQPKSAQIFSSRENTYITTDLHRKIAQLGIALGAKLANAARPANLPDTTSHRIPRRNIVSALGSVHKPIYIALTAIPLLFIFLMITAMFTQDSAILSILMVVLLLSILFSVGYVVFYALRRKSVESARLRRYQSRYGNEQISL